MTARPRAPLGDLANTPQHARLLARRPRKAGPGLAPRLQPEQRRAHTNTATATAPPPAPAAAAASPAPTAPVATGGLFMMLESPLPPAAALAAQKRAAARKHKKARQQRLKKARAAGTDDISRIPFGVMHIPKNLPSSVSPARGAAAACPPVPTNTPTNYFADSLPATASNGAGATSQRRRLKKARTHEVSPSALFVQLYARSSQKVRRPPANAPVRRNMLEARRYSKLRPPASAKEVEARRQEMAGMALTSSSDSATKVKSTRGSQKRKRHACSMSAFACAGGRDRGEGGDDESSSCLLQ